MAGPGQRPDLGGAHVHATLLVMRRATSDYVDAFWADALPCAPGGDDSSVVVGTHGGSLTGYEGVYVVERRDQVVISAPAHLVQAVRERQPRPEPALSPGWWLEQLPGWTVLGPSVHSFLDDVGLLPHPAASERATAGQMADALRHRVTAADWAESGFAGDDIAAAWLLRDRSGRPAAAANLTPFHGLPTDVGLVTATDSRGLGHGRAVGAAAARWAVEHHGIARWRALQSNVPSRRTAASLGFIDDCRQLAVRPAASPAPRG